MKTLKNYKLFTEKYGANEDVFVLQITTKFVGDDQQLELDYGFDFDDYVKYKDDDLSQSMSDDLMQQAIDEYGLEWEIEENELVITSYIGQEERLENEELDTYNDEELKWMAVEEMGIDWEIIINTEHPNADEVKEKYEQFIAKRKKVKDFNL